MYKLLTVYFFFPNLKIAYDNQKILMIRVKGNSERILFKLIIQSLNIKELFYVIPIF